MHMHACIQRYHVKGLLLGRVPNKRVPKVINAYIHIHTHTNIYIQRYDLKGSLVGRVATSEEKKSPTVVLKDVDLLVNQTK